MSAEPTGKSARQDPAPGDRVYVALEANGRTVHLIGYGVYQGDTVMGSKLPIEEAREELRSRMRKILISTGINETPTDKNVDCAIEALKLGNPRIRLDDGSYIFGAECWWDAEAELKTQFDKVVLVNRDGTPQASA